MNDKDAQLGRKLMVDELETVNEYEAMADCASPEVAEVIRDVADEEKVHAGEGAAIVAQSDERAEPAMREGLQEAARLMNRGIYSPEEVTIIAKSSFGELLNESFEKARGKGEGNRKKGSREAKMSPYPPKKSEYQRKMEERETPSSMGGNISRQNELERYPWPGGKAKERKMDRKTRYDRKTGLYLPVKSVSRPGGKGVYGTVSGGDPDIQWLRDVVELNPDRFSVNRDPQGNWLSVTDLTTNTEMDARSLAKRLEDMGVDRSVESNFDFSLGDLYRFLDETGKKGSWEQDVKDEQARLDALPENERVPWETAEINVANRYLDEADPYFAQEYARLHPNKERAANIKHISHYFTAPGAVIPYLNYVRSPERKNKEKQKDASRYDVVRENEEEEARKAAIMDSDLYYDLVADRMYEYVQQGIPQDKALKMAKKKALVDAEKQFKAHRDAIKREQTDFANRQTQSAKSLEDARAQIAETDRLGAAENADVYEPFKAVYSGYDPGNIYTYRLLPKQRETVSKVLERFKDMPPEEIEEKYPNLYKFYKEGALDMEGLLPSNETIQAVVDEWNKQKGPDKTANNKLLGKMLGEKGIRTRNIHAALGDVMGSLNVPKEADQKMLENARRAVGANIVNEELPVKDSRSEDIRNFALQYKDRSPKEIAGLFNDMHGAKGLTTTEDEVRILTTPTEEKAEVIDESLANAAEEGRKLREIKEKAKMDKFKEKQAATGDSPEKHQTSDAPEKLTPGGDVQVKEASNIEKSASFADMLSESIMKKDSEKGAPTMSNDALMRDPYRHVWMTENEPVYKDRDLNIKEDHGTGGSVKRAPADDGTSGAYDGKKIAKSFADMYAERNGFEKTNGTGLMDERAKAAIGKQLDISNKAAVRSHPPNGHGFRAESEDFTPEELAELREMQNARDGVISDRNTVETIRQEDPDSVVPIDKPGSNGTGLAETRANVAAKLADHTGETSDVGADIEDHPYETAMLYAMRDGDWNISSHESLRQMPIEGGQAAPYTPWDNDLNIEFNGTLEDTNPEMPGAADKYALGSFEDMYAERNQ